VPDLHRATREDGPIGDAEPGTVQGKQANPPRAGRKHRRANGTPARESFPQLLTDGTIFDAFCRAHIRQSIGQFAGKPLNLEPFQLDFVNELLSRDPETQRRIYQEAVLLLPRKSGKSTLIAALAVFQTIRDAGTEPQVVVAAASRDQAQIIFRQIKAFIAASPELSRLLTARQYQIDMAGGGFIRVVSSDGRLQHGSNPSMVIVDELWAHRDDGELYTALTSGSGAREEPLAVTISTPGYDREQVLGKIYQRVIETAPDQSFDSDPYYRRIARDPASGFLLYHYGAPDDADPDDPKVWRKANPAPWIGEEYLRKQRHKPSSRLEEFRRLHLAQWVNAGEESWLPAGLWQECALPGVTLDPRLPVSVGIDIGVTYDASAVVLAQKQGDRIVVESKVWVNPYQLDSALHDVWRVDIEEIREHLRELRRRYPEPAVRVDGRAIPGPAFCYDPWSFRESAQILEGEGLAMVQVNQTDTRMVPMTTDLYQAITTRRLAYDPSSNTTLTSHIMAAVAVPRGDSGWRIRKPRGSRTAKIDAAIAMILAVSQALQPAPKKSVSAFLA
jgi:phage terminase large subunit-like protein